MPIVIKEIVVKTTVEKKTPQWSQLNEELLFQLKQMLLEKLETDRILGKEKYGNKSRR